MASQIQDGITEALTATGLSQRDLASRTGISQSTLSRILSGQRTAKMTEILQIAEATGFTVGQLAGNPTTSGRVLCAARSTNGAGMEQMRQRLTHFMELDVFLDDQAIPAPR